jgi:hypothetical protein
MIRRIIIGLTAVAALAFTDTALADHAYKEVQATIMKMQPQANQLTVQVVNGKETTFTVADDAWLQVGGSTPFDGKLEEFKPGMRVTILFRSDEKAGDKPHALLMYPTKEADNNQR